MGARIASAPSFGKFRLLWVPKAMPGMAQLGKLRQGAEQPAQRLPGSWVPPPRHRSGFHHLSLVVLVSPPRDLFPHLTCPHACAG